MPDKRLSEYSTVNPVGSDKVAITRSGANYNLTAQSVANLGVDCEVYVNNFGAIADGASHPLSERYATLGEAQAVYPHATALTDEIDWCAWQAASNYVRTRYDYGYLSKNWGTGRINAAGRYMVNKPIQFSHCGVIVQGVTAGERYYYGGATTVKYNGPDGTDTAKVAIFDFFPTDETGAAPPGLWPTHGQGVFKCYDIGFFGKTAGDSAAIAAAPSTTGYVWGIRLRNGSFCEIERCNFGGGLLDGIVACSQLFLRIAFNFFYGVHRDCISILGFTGDFSTTVWIDDNEFGFCGRYAILQNYNGAIEPAPSVRRNSFEFGSANSYYYTHPEWFVQGLCAGICQIGGTFGQYSENRFEGMATQLTALWADMHFVSVGSVHIKNNRTVGLAFSTYRADPNRTTAAYGTFQSSYKYVDITDARNFHAPTPTDFNGSAQCSDIVVDLFAGYTIDVSSVGLSNSTAHSFSNGTMTAIHLPVDTSGAYYKVYPTTTAVVASRANAVSAQFLNSTYYNHPAHGAIRCASFNTKNASGTYAIEVSDGYGNWTAATSYNAVSPPSLTLYPKAKKWIKPTVYNGYVYECTVGGVSGGSEPVWPTIIGNTVVDGAVTWKCAFQIHLPLANVYETMLYNQRSGIADAAPTTGRWTEGDKVYKRVPAIGDNVGWMCIGAGIPGTWQAFGAPGGGGGAVAGSDKQVQFNDGGSAFGTDVNFTYDKTTDILRTKSWMIWDGTNDLVGYRSTNKFNIFIGFEAGKNSATNPATAGGQPGTANTAVGYQSQLFATTASSYNTSIGTHSLNGITTGDYNTGLGANTGLPITTGSSNVYVGHDAGAVAGATVASNTFVGRRAGHSATSSSTVGIGFEALRLCTGTFNTAVGSSSGMAVTSGGSNVLLGLGAASTLTTGSQNICMGVYAEPSAAGASNEWVVGSQYTGIRQVYIGTGVTYATPVATTINATGQAGTDKAGVDLSIAGGKGTGSGAGGAVRIKVAPAGSTGTTLGTLVDGLVVAPDKTVALAALTVATLPTAGTAGRFAYVSDGTAALAWGATVTGGSTTKYLVFDNGTNWTVAGK